MTERSLAGFAKSYDPTTPSDWAAPVPSTIEEALDRLAAAGSLESVRLVAVPFTFATPSPVVLPAVLTPTAVIARAGVVITTPFNDAGAALQLGTPGAPGLFLAPADSNPAAAGQYESDAIVTPAVASSTRLTIAAGASTQGEGLAFLEVQLAS